MPQQRLDGGAEGLGRLLLAPHLQQEFGVFAGQGTDSITVGLVVHRGVGGTNVGGTSVGRTSVGGTSVGGTCRLMSDIELDVDRSRILSL